MPGRHGRATSQAHVCLGALFDTRARYGAAIFAIDTAGIEDSDLVHEFHFSSELAGGGFWGFSGYLISRGECVIHAKVTSIDN